MTRRSFFAIATAAFAAKPVSAIAPKLAPRTIPFRVRETVEDAFRALGVLRPGECASANDLAFGARLLHQWFAALDPDLQRESWRNPARFQLLAKWSLVWELAPTYRKFNDPFHVGDVFTLTGVYAINPPNIRSPRYFTVQGEPRQFI